MHRRNTDVAAEGEGVIAAGPGNVIVDVPHRIVSRQWENETRNGGWKQPIRVNLPVTLGLELVEVVSRIELLDRALDAVVELIHKMWGDGPIKAQHAGVVG